MIKIHFITVFYILTTIHLNAQKVFSAEQVDKLDYQNGIYETKEDFIRKTPSLRHSVRVKNRFPKDHIDSMIRRCFFIDLVLGKKIKKAFAVVYNGNLYFRTGAIIKNRDSNDKSLSSATSASSQFVLVLKGGNNYLYTEASIINHWQIGLSAGLARGAIYKMNDNGTRYYTNTKGLIWDFKKSEFNIFRDCADFKDFIDSQNVKSFDCTNNRLTYDKIVDYIEKIK
ncbi:hypothetical protein ACE939_04305 [Aquimarina sp. W85]|uniref:hypothetical protein n=1 Tax=Aquimarina rhodophyticola TaxID=3342246 RepID=UPI00366BA4AD